MTTKRSLAPNTPQNIADRLMAPTLIPSTIIEIAHHCHYVDSCSFRVQKALHERLYLVDEGDVSFVGDLQKKYAVIGNI